jgi:MFS superfamily sulfate permease-like transporter
MSAALRKWPNWLKDCIAGLSEAALSIPEVMGYARIAGMSPISGLYTLLLPLLAFAICGSSRSLVVAADSATASILSGSLTPLAGQGSADYIRLITLTTFLTAAFLLIARLFRLGFLADFLSRTVLVGFLTGVGIQIAIMMLHEMTGLQHSSGNVLIQLWQDGAHLNAIHAPTFALSCCVAVTLFLGQKFLPRLPTAFIIVAGSIIASRAFDFPHSGISTLGDIKAGFPKLTLPSFDLPSLLTATPIAASCVFVIITQSAATIRAFSFYNNEKTDINSDIFGLFAANMSAALSGTFVVNGSPTKTAFAFHCGARSQLSQIVVAILAGLLLFCATGFLQYLPHCVLAAIVFVVGLNMLEIPKLLSILKESPGEFRLAILTLTTVVCIGVEEGIFMAIVVSLLRHVRHSYAPHTDILFFSKTGEIETTIPRNGAETEPGLLIYRFGADLFYANCTRFIEDMDRLVATAPHPVHQIVVDASAMTNIDYSASITLRELLSRLEQKNITLSFGRVSTSLRADMIRHRLVDSIGQDKLFNELHVAVATARQALSR